MKQICEWCGNEFTSSRKAQRFCNQACWAKWKKGKNAHNEKIDIPEEERTRQCLICGTDFSPAIDAIRNDMGIYCSRECYWKGKRRRRGEQKTRSDWYQSQGWCDFSRSIREGATCENCGGTKDLCGHHKIDPFPNRDVRLLMDRENVKILCNSCHPKEHASKKPILVCENCGESFVQPRRTSRKFCSFECYNASRDNTKECKQCGKKFKPRNHNDHCSLACAAKSTAAIKHARRVTLTCSHCGKRYAVPPCKAKNAKRTFCSSECRSAFAWPSHGALTPR